MWIWRLNPMIPGRQKRQGKRKCGSDQIRSAACAVCCPVHAPLDLAPIVAASPPIHHSKLSTRQEPKYTHDHGVWPSNPQTATILFVHPAEKTNSQMSNVFQKDTPFAPKYKITFDTIIVWKIFLYFRTEGVHLNLQSFFRKLYAVWEKRA